MRPFLLMWFGQFVSLLGSMMTTFALPIWIFSQTQRVQELALLNLAFLIPAILLSPIAGTMVDRHSRKMIMLLSDAVAGLTTLLLFILVTTDTLVIWHLYLTAVISGAVHSFQFPAYLSSISLMVPKAHYGRANGLTSLARDGAEIFSPLLAGALLAGVGLRGILVIDLITFLIAVSTLLVVPIPSPRSSPSSPTERSSIWRDSLFGIRYILARPSLLGIQLVFLVCNFLWSIAMTTQTALILFRTGQNVNLLARVSSAGALGGVMGGVLMSVWGGPKRRIHGVLVGWAILGLVGTTFFGLGRSWPVWATFLFLGMMTVPFMNGSNTAIWQAKVDPAVQGRVFAIRIMIARAFLPLAKLIAIPLADRLLEPVMQVNGSLTPIFGGLVGVGPGAGTALIFVFAGILVTMVALGAYAVPQIRRAEDILPDHEY